MAEKIKLVQGDNRPFITITLSQVDGSPVNLSGSTVTVAFRAVGSTLVLATIPVVVTDDLGGIGYFDFPGATLDVEPGPYEGEVKIVFANGDKQRVYDLLKFNLREKVA